MLKRFLIIIGAGLATILPPAAASAPPAGAGELAARGVVRALHRPVLSSQIAARIRRLPVRAGEDFAKGDVLVAFHCTEFQAELSKARSELTAARAKLESAHKLAALKSIGNLEVTLSEALAAQAESERRIADLTVSRCRIRAPFAGRVVTVLVHEHQSVHEQQELLEIVDSSHLEIEFVAPGTWLGWLRPGQALALAVDETGRTVQGRVATTGAAVDPVSQSVSVRAAITGVDRSLVPGMSGTVRFPR